MATNFVAQDGKKLVFTAFIVCAGILQRLGRLQTHTYLPTNLLHLVKISQFYLG